MGTSRKKKSQKNSVLKTIGHIFAFVGIIIGSLLVVCIVALFVLFRGPSETARDEWVNMFNETSQMKWLPRLFLSSETVDSILSVKEQALKTLDAGTTSDVSQIVIDEETVTDEIEIIDIKGGSFKGKMMIIHDPSKVFLGTVPEFYRGTGEVVLDIMSHYDGVIAGINAGDFIDNGANASFTAMPLGLVISNGEIVLCEDGDYDTRYHISGFTKDNVFVMGNISANEALEMGIRDAVYTNEITTGPFLIVNGESMLNEIPAASTYGSGKNPRTVIGQKKTGEVVMLVVDGRQANSIGATFEDLIYVLQDYDVYNACAMDGGTSSQMVYDGEVINHPYAASGPRRCPTAWLVLE